MSFANIEPDVSVTITTVAARCSAATVRSGRPSATSSAASASSASSAGMWRAQPTRAGHARQHVDVRVADGVAALPPLRDDVGGQRERDSTSPTNSSGARKLI